MTLSRCFIETPVGTMRVIASSTALCAFEFHEPGRTARLDERLRRWFGHPVVEDRESAVLEETRRWAAAYFAGESAAVFPLPLDLRGAPFECRVWTALRDVPAGTTTTYGAVASRIGAPAAARAVGLANGANPVAIIVPCHRVIGANGALTGYGGGLDTKAWLLAHERRWAPTPSLF